MKLMRIASLLAAGTLSLIAVRADADSQTMSATVLANDTGVGSEAWTTASFPAAAALFGVAPITTNSLETTGFGFTIPSNAVIQGLVAQVNKSAVTALGSTADYQIRLLKNGAPAGGDRSVVGSWPGANSPTFYGGLIDLWNTNWSAADINTTGFGVGISMTGTPQSGALFSTANVHAVQVTVYYYVPCPATVSLGGCDSTFEKASLKIDESKPGKEKLQASLGKGGALTQTAIGDFVGNTGAFASLCIYDATNTLVQQFVLDSGGTCGGVPCWKDSGGDYPDGKGVSYKDKDGVDEGVTQLKIGGGDVGKSKAQLKAGNKNGYMTLGTAGLLAGEPLATIQIRTSAGMCLSSTLTDVSTNADGKFAAKK